MRSNNLMVGNDSRETILSSRYHHSQDVYHPSKPQHHRDERSTCSTVSSLFSDSVSPSRSYARHEEQPFDESDTTEEILHRIEAAEAPFDERKEEKILPIHEQQEEETCLDDLREIPLDEVPHSSRCASCDKTTRTHLDDDIRHLMEEDLIVDDELGRMEDPIIPNPFAKPRTKPHPTYGKVAWPTVAFPNRKKAKNVQVDQDETDHLVVDELGCMEDPIISNPFVKPRTKPHPTHGKVSWPTVSFPNRKKAKNVQVDQDETDQRGTTTRRRPLHITDNARENHIIDGKEDSCSVSALVHIHDNRLSQEKPMKKTSQAPASSTSNVLGNNSSGLKMAPARRIRQVKRTSEIFPRRDFSMIEPELEENEQNVCRSNIARETRRSRLSIDMMGRCQKAKRLHGSASLQRFATILVPFLFRVLSQHRQKRLENSPHGHMVISRQSLSREHVLSGMVKLAMLMIQQQKTRKHKKDENGGDSCLIDSEDEVKVIMDKELRRLFRDMNETLEIFSFPSDESPPEPSLGRFDDYLDDDGLAGELERSLDETNRPEILDSLGDGDPEFQELFETACMATDLSRHDYIDAHYYDNLLLEDDDDMDEELANLYWVEKKIKSELSQVISVEEQVVTETNLPVTELSADEKYSHNESRETRILAYEMCTYNKMDTILRSGRDGNESQQGSTAGQMLKDCDMIMLLFPDLESVPTDEQGQPPTEDNIFAAAESEILGEFRDEVESRQDQEADGSVTELSAADEKYSRNESRDTRLSAGKMCLQDKMDTVVRSRDNNESQQGSTAGQTLKDSDMPTKVLLFPDLEAVPTDEQYRNPTEDNDFDAAESEILGQFRDEVESLPGQEADGSSLSHSEETILETVFSAPSEEINASFDTIDMWRAKISEIVDCEKSTPPTESEHPGTPDPNDDMIMETVFGAPSDEVESLPGQEADGSSLSHSEETILETVFSAPSEEINPSFDTIDMWRAKISEIVDCEKSTPPTEGEHPGTPDPNDDIIMKTVFGAPSVDESETKRAVVDSTKSTGRKREDSEIPDPNDDMIMETVFGAPSIDDLGSKRAVVDSTKSTGSKSEDPEIPDPNDEMIMETVFGAPSIDDLESKRAVVDSTKSTGSKSEDPEIPDADDEMIMETVFVAPSLEMITEALFTLSEERTGASDDMDSRAGSNVANLSWREEPDGLLGIRPMMHFKDDEKKQNEESPSDDFSGVDGEHAASILGVPKESAWTNPCANETSGTLLGIQPMVFHEKQAKEEDFFVSVDGKSVTSMLSPSAGSASVHRSWEEDSASTDNLEDTRELVRQALLQMKPLPTINHAPHHAKIHPTQVKQMTEKQKGGEFYQDFPSLLSASTESKADVPNEYRGANYPSLLNASIFSVPEATSARIVAGRESNGMVLSEHNRPVLNEPLQSPASRKLDLKALNKSLRDISKQEKQETNESKQEKQETNENATVTVINKDENSPPVSELEIMDLPGVVSDLEIPPRQHLGLCDCILVGQSTDSSRGNSIQDVQYLNKIGLKPMSQRHRPLPTNDLPPLGLDLWEPEAHLSAPVWSMDPMIDEHNADSIVKALGLVLKTGGNLDESPPTNGCLKDCVTPLAAESFNAISQAIFPKKGAKQKCIMMSEKDDNETLTFDEKETNADALLLLEDDPSPLLLEGSSSMALLHLHPSGDDKIEALRDQYDGEYPPEEEASFCNDWGREELLNHHVGDYIEAMRSRSSETLLNPVGEHPVYSNSSSSNWKDHPPRMMMKKKDEPNCVSRETVVGNTRTFDEDQVDLAFHFASPQGSLLGPYDGFLEQQQQQAMMERPDDISEFNLVVDSAAAAWGTNRPTTTTTTSSSRPVVVSAPKSADDWQPPLEQFRREGGGPITCSEQGGELVAAAMESGNSFWCNSEGDPFNVLGSMIRGYFGQEPSNPNAAAGR